MTAKQQTIDAVANIPPFTRKFTWDASAPHPATRREAGTGSASSPESAGRHSAESSVGDNQSSDADEAEQETVSSEVLPLGRPSDTAPTSEGDTGNPDVSPLEAPDSPERPAGVTPSTPFSGTTTTPSPVVTETNSIAYMVQQGETLWGISKKFGTTVAAIAAANILSFPNQIRAGQKLVIPR